MEGGAGLAPSGNRLLRDRLGAAFIGGDTMKYLLFLVQAGALGLSLVLAAPALAGDVHKRGDAYYVYLPATSDFMQVVKTLETEIENKNWEVLRVQNIDTGLKENYQMDIQSKVVYACKSQYLVQAVRADPNITLIVPCRFAVYRVDDAGKAVGGEPGKAGKIIVGITDPVAEAHHLGIKQLKAVEVASKELREVLQELAEYYKEDYYKVKKKPKRSR
jgi:uncharacterized protein (DUF302 family)